MFELLFALSLAIYTLISGQDHPLLLGILIIVCLPGLYATKTGAPTVPSLKKTMTTMLELANIKPGEEVHDLGCGDGRLVFAAAKLGANATGYEISLPTFLLAKLRGIFHPKARILYRNFWHVDLRNADVIFCYLLPSSMQTFKEKIWPTLKPGCRVISHAYRMEDVAPEIEKNGIIRYVQ